MVLFWKDVAIYFHCLQLPLHSLPPFSCCCKIDWGKVGKDDVQTTQTAAAGGDEVQHHWNAHLCIQILQSCSSWVTFNRLGTCQVTCQSLPTLLQHTNNNNKNTTMRLLLSSGKQLKALFITTVSTSLLINIWLSSQPSQSSRLSFSPCPNSSFLPGSALPAHLQCQAQECSSISFPSSAALSSLLGSLRRAQLMTNGLLTAEVLFSWHIITQRHSDAVLPGAFQNTKSVILQETEWFFFLLPLSCLQNRETGWWSDEVAKSVSVITQLSKLSYPSLCLLPRQSSCNDLINPNPKSSHQTPDVTSWCGHAWDKCEPPVTDASKLRTAELTGIPH